MENIGARIAADQLASVAAHGTGVRVIHARRRSAALVIGPGHATVAAANVPAQQDLVHGRQIDRQKRCRAARRQLSIQRALVRHTADLPGILGKARQKRQQSIAQCSFCGCGLNRVAPGSNLAAIARTAISEHELTATAPRMANAVGTITPAHTGAPAHR